MTGVHCRQLVPQGALADAKALRREVHSVLRQVSHDYDRMQYNTVVSGCMKLLNALDAFKPDASNSAADQALGGAAPADCAARAAM